MKRYSVILIFLMVSLSAFSQVGESNRDIIHVNDLDRSKVKVRKSDGSITDYNKARNRFQAPKQKPKNLEGQLDQTLNDFNQLDPANKNLDGSEPQAQAGAEGGEDKLDGRTNKPKVPQFFGNMLGGLKSSVVKKLLKANPMSNMSHDQLKQVMENRFEGTKYGAIIKKHPKILDVMVEMIRDEKALPEIVSIMDKQDQLLTYTYIFMGMFILATLLSVFMFQNSGAFKRIMFKIFLTVSLPFINLLIFYLMFKKNLDPAVDIFKKYAFS